MTLFDRKKEKFHGAGKIRTYYRDDFCRHMRTSFVAYQDFCS